MSSSRLLKRRMKSAKNISQITKAMEMVSASKMRRSQEQAVASRPYAEKLTIMLKNIAMHTNPSQHPLLQTHSSPKKLIVLFSTDRGLAGGLNTNLFKRSEEFVATSAVEFIVIGKKAREYAIKFGHKIVADFSGLPEHLHFEDALPIAEVMMKGFLTGQYSEVYFLHMQFVTTLAQKPCLEHLLPLTVEQIEQPAELITAKTEYLFEPSSSTILDFLLPYYVEIETYQTLLDAKASEHSARMVAMKNASDNAKEVIDELQLIYNKTRQAGITKELIEITTSALSLGS